jgi:hypothetical protein
MPAEVRFSRAAFSADWSNLSTTVADIATKYGMAGHSLPRCPVAWIARAPAWQTSQGLP